ncbi:hypothetical protein L211DRAFT_856099 [Terfezia boudieri ATCC MYA-4762]|uniref:DDE Tnp4 domain-containing protein n=2 Tax=Terfezia boudieri ATCC MYA-4762 TaxID=1051890 RepID=A0A3N4LUT4_9PEZI|nr:hypothetical protein L211DRAFT_856099 [Terfezia boudieri ATCC MYA-4762]
MTFDQFTETECIEFFRFTRSEIRQILPYLELDQITYRYRYQASAEEAFCVLLSRLSSNKRLKDEMRLFGKSRTWQSVIFNDVVTYLVTRYQEKLEWDSQRLTYKQLNQYADHVGLPAERIWGFVDGTLKVVCRPKKHQRRWYSGYKKRHAVKFQAIATPDGLISHLAGPFEGKLGDWSAWKQSKIENHLQAVQPRSRRRLYVYGDPAYSAGFGVIGPYKALPHQPLPLRTQAFNAYMSSLRIAVEHSFSKISALWPFVTHSRALKIDHSPVGGYYMIAVLLTNIHTCLRGSQISTQFSCPPPSLAEYLSLGLAAQ